MKTREDYERERAETVEKIEMLMSEHVTNGLQPWVMRDQWDNVAKIAAGLSDMTRTADGYTVEFFAGTEVGDACRTAHMVHCHTGGATVEFEFKGAWISMKDRKP